MKTALLQSSVGVGGRSKVLAASIRVLNSHSHSIDLHTLSNSTEIEKFLNYYGLVDIDITGITHSGSIVPGTIYQQPVLNIAARSSIAEYDLVFNSNNCIRFLPNTPKYIHYVHFPTSRNPRIDPKYDRLPYRIASVPLILMSTLTATKLNGHVLANSKFTLEHTQEAYDSLDAQVLYPPALESVRLREFSGEGIVSVGSFNQNKRQLLQLQMAKHFPDTEFRIIGSIASEPYYASCRKYVAENELDNVTLLPDVSDQRLRDELQRSRIFLHTMKNERFGIAPVEGINHGCVPVVHNSGGQSEVVPDSDFRFDNPSECKAILADVLSGKSPSKKTMRTHLKQFTESNFRSGLSKYI
ncbi:glycosyltransferase [Halorubrum ezzemoulense]|uniref:glycosyltransferase n=1 Tax=Halorubrum ezzemoulense TaxID=337243 RepID=UPI00232CC0C1|nr:glycosyltransferase [Halorubrum ezzemoulense]MDB9253341.1 glycosyltransferase [Halorubrum ezzemoulense]MDB9256294.1 glycosyltransferase [Halorubrum ezzemoulense]MDB9277658.1 glycosyltransferase [Halorubrum ezzemoulense]